MIETFNLLTKEIKEHDNIVIMAHKGMDLDAYGASLCLYEIVKSFEKNVMIYMSKIPENNSIEKSIKKLSELNYSVNYVYSENDIPKENTMAVVLDTHKASLLENYDAIRSFEIFIIDHHISNVETIESKYTYINHELSSTVEILANYTKYLNKTLPPIIATIMLAGLEVDTNRFDVKTTDKTYEAAAYLTKLGADNIIKKQLLKEDKDNYCKRQDFVKNSDMITDNISLCVMDNNVYKKYMLALISEDLLQFDNVEAAFTIGYIAENTVGISARSIGNIDVEQVMYKLGGGGHKTDAATSINDVTLEDVKDKLIEVIKEGM